ncbi:uncharacterized protein LOC62_01G000726 [Vanrija pseudolonga]|uniref:ABM domain-containing protein n=1 Tax=Vanrija pseudolonga TaxID=143232 RepID=A0AAF0XZM8_9TREE|nr:hypothetical protein LOC62_01G000726 [Vanrija pseudolonga]
MVVLIAKFKAVDLAAADKLEQHLKNIQNISLTDAEPGCSVYQGQRSDKDPLEFLMYEEYDDKAAVDAHMASAHFGKLAADAPNLIAGGPAGIDISFWTRF